MDITTKDIATTTKTSGIRILNRDIYIFINEYGQKTPILIVAECELDSIKYAALYDISTKKCYAVEIVRINNQIKEFRDLDGMLQDEEWGVVSNFFLKEEVYEKARIDTWIRNTSLRERMSLGRYPVPSVMMKRWKERYDARFTEKE
jgi:hypothetical protein